MISQGSSHDNSLQHTVHSPKMYLSFAQLRFYHEVRSLDRQDQRTFTEESDVDWIENTLKNLFFSESDVDQTDNNEKNLLKNLTLIS